MKTKKFSFPHRVSIECPRIDAGRFAAGDFSSRFWRQAFQTSAFYKRGTRIYEKEWGQLLPAAPIPVTLALGRGTDALYVGIKCTEPEPDKTKLHYLENRTEVWLDDSIELFFDPRHIHREFYQLIINSGGFYHAFHRKTDREKVTWNPGIASRPFSWEHGWGIELALALDSFPVHLKDTSVWGLNVGRNFGVAQRDDRVESSLAPLHEHSWDRPSRFADLHFAHKPAYVTSIVLNGRNLVNADTLFISPELRYGNNDLRITLGKQPAGPVQIRSRVGAGRTTITANGKSLRAVCTVPRTLPPGDRTFALQVKDGNTVLFNGSWRIPLPALIELRPNLLFPAQSEITIGAASSFLRNKMLRVTTGARSVEQPARGRQRLQRFFPKPSRKRTSYTLSLVKPDGSTVTQTTTTFPSIPPYLVPDHPRLAGPHPRLLFTENDPAAVLDRIRANEARSADYDALKAKAERFVDAYKRPPPKSAAGLTWYRCYEHGARLEHLPDGRHRCPVGGEIHRDIRLDYAWLFWEHGNNLAMAVWLAFIHRMENRPRFRDTAKDLLLWYGANYLTFDYCNGPGADTLSGGGIRDAILSESGLISMMGIAYDLLHDDLTTEERRTVRRNCFEPVCEQMMRYPGGMGNWKTHLNNALAIIGTVTGTPEYLGVAVGNRRGFLFDMRRGVTSGGFWHQGAIGYHFYVLSAYLWLAEFLIKSHGSNLYGNNRFRKMFLAPLRFAYPDLSLPDIGTGGGGNLAAFAGLYELALPRMPELQPYAGRLRPWFTPQEGDEPLLHLLRLTSPKTMPSRTVRDADR
ncbi:MAG: hypothetical protein JXB13_10745, partial [Phycisphaerae bacterium]|nr:hypothetical protein [Phycisphaerae bacterium]